MRKLLLILFGLSVLALDFAALDDLTTSNQPNYTSEYLMLFISIPLLLFLGFSLWKKN